MQEHRKSPRCETKIDILFKESGAFIRSYMLNVSNGGLFLKTDKPLPIDTTVTLLIRLPGQSEPMELQGCVVWTNPRGKNTTFPCGMGIQFTNITPEQKKIIDDFVAQHREHIKEYGPL
ncbi:MAG: TIGR02266 family protein [Desulfobacterota bacterium]|nr:TIGR02266 family protein [Thermodesulfobacteriota bacterium]